VSGSIIRRLTLQLAAKGNSNARGMAISLLQKQGILHPNSENLTEYGKTRQAMSPEDRAKDRQAKYSGHKAKDFKYDPNTNRATLRK